MAFLRNVSERFWTYVSPRKTQQRREKPFKVPALPVKAKPLVQDASPPKITVDRVESWVEVRTPNSAGSIDRTLLPPSPPTSVEHHLDLEGETLIQDSVEDALEADKTDSSGDDWDANEETIVVDDGEYYEEQRKIDREKERQRREEQGRELREAGWTEDAVFLFQKLGMRGFEPLMPIDWVNDFDSLPVDLFTANENKAFIKSDSDHDHHAQLALADLFALGGRDRDAVLTKAPVRTPGYHIQRTIEKYYQWAMKDGSMQHVWQDISLFEVMSTPANVHANVTEAKMIQRLGKLLEKWETALQDYQDRKGGRSTPTAPPEPPTLYGVVASHTIMAFVSYVPPIDNNPAVLRMIAMFDFGLEGYDVWNSLAIAIFIIYCRNRMKQLKEFLPEPKTSTPRDPDA